MGKRERLSNLVVKEVSFVPDGDNPPARIAIWKRRETLLEKLRALMGSGKPDAEIEKELFDEIREDRIKDDVVRVLVSRLEDLASAVRSIIWWENPEEVEGTPEERIRQSIEQFAEGTESDLPGIFAGQIVKAFQGTEDPGLPAVRKQVCKTLGVDEPADAGKGGTGMDLTKLSAEDREKVEKALKAAEHVSTLETLIAKMQGENPELVQLRAEVAKLKGTKDDSLDSLPAEIRKQVEPIVKALRAENDALRVSVESSTAALTKAAERIEKLESTNSKAEFAKSVGNALDGLGKPACELIDMLWALPNEDVRKSTLETLKSAAEQARRGGIFDELGLSGGDGNSHTGQAMSKIEAAAAEIRKARPELTPEAARVAAMEADPSLYDDATVRNRAH